MTLVYLSGNRIQGLSSDTKPSNVTANAVFFETDTSKSFDYSSGSWTERTVAVTIGDVVTAHDTTIGNYTRSTTSTASSEGSTASATQVTGATADATNGLPSWVLVRTVTINGGVGTNVTNGSINFSFYLTGAGGAWTNYEIYRRTSSGTTTIYASSANSNMNVTISEGTITALVSYEMYVQVQYGYGHAIMNSTSFDYGLPTVKAYATNNNSANYWITDLQTNPSFYVDMGSSTRTVGVTIKPNSTTTETEIAIQTSDNASAWTTQRTITVSNLTNGSDNFIRFPPVSCRYVRIYGNSGDSRKLALNDFTVKKNVSDSTLTSSHGHLDISASSTSIGLDGT